MSKTDDFIPKSKKSLIPLSIMFFVFFTVIYSLNYITDPNLSSPLNFFSIPRTGDSSIIQKNEACFIEYEVKKGDTLKGIWKNSIVSYPYNIAMSLVLKQNKLRSLNDINVGNIILIPTRTDETCETYIIKNGDTLINIANHFKKNETLDNMIKIIIGKNGKENVKNIEPGQTLLIP